MRLRGGQSRFLVGTLAAWVVVRAGLLPMGGDPATGARDLRYAARPALPGPPDPIASADGPARAFPAGASNRPPLPARSPGPLGGAGRPAPLPSGAGAVVDRLAEGDAPGAVPARREQGGAAPFVAHAPALPPETTRWGAQAYLFVRPGSGQASLAANGALGGSQAAARVTYRLNASGPVRTAIAARLYAPLASKGAEAALGFDWHPLPGVPLRFTVERRFDLDGAGRHAWSAYGAGGFYQERFGGRLALDGYGQAGVVGIERRDLFVDGALRAGRRYRIGPATATIGAGLWGAAQPGVSRLDVGPHLAGVLPIATHDVTVALEGRLRVAGRASPGSGAALTLGLDL